MIQQYLGYTEEQKSMLHHKSLSNNIVSTQIFQFSLNYKRDCMKTTFSGSRNYTGMEYEKGA